MIRAEFDGEDGFGQYTDALKTQGALVKIRQALRVAKPRSLGPRTLLTIRLWFFCALVSLRPLCGSFG